MFFLEYVLNSNDYVLLIASQSICGEFLCTNCPHLSRPKVTPKYTELFMSPKQTRVFKTKTSGSAVLTNNKE